MRHIVQRDAKGQPYINIADGYTRITLVDRDPLNIKIKWHETRFVLRIQQYDSPDNANKLRPGPEIPVKDAAEINELCGALTTLFQLMLTSEHV